MSKKKLNVIYILIFFIFLFIGCNKGKEMTQKKIDKELYYAIIDAEQGYGYDWLNKVLAKGADPNYCIGRYGGWSDSNPLSVVVGSIYDTYIRQILGEGKASVSPDIETLHILLHAGADIHRRPYVWQRVFYWDSSGFEISKSQIKDRGTGDLLLANDSYIDDANRLILELIQHGADPDMKGHPVPFNGNGEVSYVDDNQAFAYFKNGSRPINLAIEKGIAWEKQVDLLLQYVELDEESLRAADRSNDQRMIEKIQKLWKEQNERKK